MQTDFKFTISGKLHQSFTNATQKAERNVKTIDGKLDTLKNKFGETRNSVLAMAGAGYALTKAYSSASQTLKAQGELASLGIAVKGITGITQAGQEMALKFGQVTAPEFVRASYDIKSGIASLTDEGVSQFTKFASTTAVATKATTGEMTKLFALGYGIYRQDFESDFSFGNKFSGAVAAAVQSFRTDGSDLSQGLSNLGGTATAMGVSMAEQFAVIGLAKETYSTASEAATGYRSVLNGLGKAQEKLGMDFTDAQGKLLELPAILDMIKDKYGDMDLSENMEISEALGGTEASKFLMSLINKTDKLRESTAEMNKAMDGGISKAEEMAMAMDRGQGLEKLGNAFSYIGFTIGKTLEPAFNGLASAVGWVAKGLAWVDEKASFLIPTIVYTGIAVGGTISVLLTAKLASNALSFAKLTLAKQYWKATGAVGKFGMATTASSASAFSISAAFSKATLAVRAFGMALLLNPIGLVVAGIAGAAVLVYKYWQPIKAFMGGVWDGFKSSFAPIAPLIDGLSIAFAPVIDIAKSVFQWFSELFTPVQKTEQQLAGFAESGKAFGEILANGFKLALTPITLLLDGISMVGKGIGWLGEKVGLFKSDNKPKEESKSFFSSLWGGDDDDTTATTSTTTPAPKAKKVVAAVAGTVMASQAAMASPQPANALPEVYDYAHPQAQQQTQQQQYIDDFPTASDSSNTSAMVTQHVTINVTVNNPASNVDIEKAVVNATRKIGQETSLNDENI